MENLHPRAVFALLVCLVATVLVVTGCTGTGSSHALNPTSGAPSSTSQAVNLTIDPPSASLQAGGAQQFSASVAGTSNTSVNWTATGGTVSSTGLYIASTTAGNFAVTATSVADSSKTVQARSPSHRPLHLPPLRPLPRLLPHPPSPRMASPGPSATPCLSDNS